MVRLLCKFGDKISSFADPGCLSWILDPGSEFFPSRIPDSGSKFFPSWIPDPGSEFFPSRMLDPRSASKNFSILTKKKWFLSSQKYDPGFPSWIRIPDLNPDFLPIPDPDSGSQIPNPGVKKAPDPWSGSRIRICNNGNFWFAQGGGGSVGYWLSRGAAVLTTHSMEQLSVAFMCQKEFSVNFI